MGEMAVSAQPDAELYALGLGSCIGLAVVDQTAGVAGLAHIVLPQSRADDDPRSREEDETQSGKFANLAVPRLLSRMRSQGGVLRRFEAALVGGAKMFELQGALDVGARNEQAVRVALRRAGVAVRAARTGGAQGRTVRVQVGTGTVTVRSARSAPVVLLHGGASAPGTRPSRSTPIAPPPPRLGAAGGC